MKNTLGFTRITFIMMLGIFATGTFALTQYAQAEQHAYAQTKGICKMCGMPKDQCTCDMKKQAPQKKWCDAHGQRDLCHLKAASQAEATTADRGGLWCRTKAGFSAATAKVRGWFKRKPKNGQGELSDVGGADLQALIATGKPVVAKFHAVWCPACKTMKPIDLKVAASNPGVTLVQVDFEKYGAVAKQYKVMGFPTYVFFKNGKQQAMHAGGMTQEAFSKRVQDLQ